MLELQVFFCLTVMVFLVPQRSLVLQLSNACNIALKCIAIWLFMSVIPCNLQKQLFVAFYNVFFFIHYSLTLPT